MKNSYKAQKYEESIRHDPIFHDTWKLLKNFRDVRWSLHLSVQQVRMNFEIEYNSSIDEFLDSIYLAGATLEGSKIEYHAKCIERSNKMLKLVESSVELLRENHKNGETYYWILFYTYLSPQEPKSVADIIETLRSHLDYISYKTYYRYRKDAIDALSNVLWGYTSKECIDMLEKFFPDSKKENN